MVQTDEIILRAVPALCSTISAYLQKTEFSEPLNFDAQNEAVGVIMEGNGRQKKYSLPLRLGILLDDLLLYKQQGLGARKTLKLYGGSVDLLTNMFVGQGDRSSILTEKEIAILQFLDHQNEERVKKEDLLRGVWNYADGLETHTLETHIYRLRQKIEVDPSKPRALVNENNGYKLIRG